MKPTLLKTIAAAVTILSTVSIGHAEVNQAPDGDYSLYRTSNYFSINSGGWNYSSNMGQEVVFEDSKLYIHNICGVGWAVGEITEDMNQAVFVSGQYVSDTSRLCACYKDGDGYVDIPEFVFEYTEDRERIRLLEYENHNVILKIVYESGYEGMRWSEIDMYRWIETPPQPAADAVRSYMRMDYKDGFGSARSKVVDMMRAGEDIWVKDLAYDGSYLRGEIRTNGNLRFYMPQYQGLKSNYFQYAFVVSDDPYITLFEMELQDDGSYVQQSGTEIWAGEITPSYVVATDVVLTPVSVYEGAPEAPTNVFWSDEYEHFFDFDLSMTGLNGEELAADWVYWQVLVDGEPFTFSFDVYTTLSMVLSEETDEMPANKSFYVAAGGKFMNWGNLGKNKYRCYMPQYSGDDNISIRSGYKVGDEMYWSEPIAVIDLNKIPNTLPDNALYFTHAALDTEYGPYDVSGEAVYAEYTDTAVRLSGVLGHDGWIEGIFSDPYRRVATFASSQVVGTSEDGLPISLVPAYGEYEDYNYDQLIFTPAESFSLKLNTGGKTLSPSDKNMYLLEVTGTEITNVWCPGYNFTIVTETMAQIPDEAVRCAYEMTYLDIYDNEMTCDVTIARLGDKVWLSDIVADDVCIEGAVDGDNLIFDMPQYVGVTNGQISYASADPWSFYQMSMTLIGMDDGAVYTTSDEIWIGTGIGYPIWRAHYRMSFRKKGCMAATVGTEADEIIRIVDGAFVSSASDTVTVYTLSGCSVINRDLKCGIYVVVTPYGVYKMSVR